VSYAAPELVSRLVLTCAECAFVLVCMFSD